MSGGEWLRVALAAAALTGMLPALRWLTRRAGANAEVARKSVHIALGCACMSFPWVFARPLPVWTLAACVTLPLALLRALPPLRSGVGSVLHGVGRISFGDVCFAPAVATVFHLAAGDKVAYLAPLGVLTIADAAAALAGTRWGRTSYMSGGVSKTLVGSMAFLAAAWLCTALPLALAGRMDWPAAAMAGCVLGMLAMMAEGMADRGFDNLVVPLLAAFILERLMPLGHGALFARMAAAVVLLGVVTAGARWSKLDGGALLGAALLGYACAVLGDWRFVLPPLGVFLCHLYTTWRHEPRNSPGMKMDTVIAYSLSCLPWALLVERGWPGSASCLAGASFGLGTHLALADVRTRLRLPGITRNVGFSIAKGWLCGAAPGLVWLWADWRNWTAPALAVMAGGLVLATLFQRPGPLFGLPRRAERYLLAVLSLALAASAVAFL